MGYFPQAALSQKPVLSSWKTWVLCFGFLVTWYAISTWPRIRFSNKISWFFDFFRISESRALIIQIKKAWASWVFPGMNRPFECSVMSLSNSWGDKELLKFLFFHIFLTKYDDLSTIPSFWVSFFAVFFEAGFRGGRGTLSKKFLISLMWAKRTKETLSQSVLPKLLMPMHPGMYEPPSKARVLELELLSSCWMSISLKFGCRES